MIFFKDKMGQKYDKLLFHGDYKNVITKLNADKMKDIYLRWSDKHSQQEIYAVYKAQLHPFEILIEFIQRQKKFKKKNYTSINRFFLELTGNLQTAIDLTKISRYDLVGIIMLLDIYNLLHEPGVSLLFKPGKYMQGLIMREIPDYRLEGLKNDEDLEQLLFNEPAPMPLEGMAAN